MQGTRKATSGDFTGDDRSEFFQCTSSTFIVFIIVRKALAISFPSISPTWYLTYLQNWRMADDITNPYLAHLWSLAVEEQFYLVWPLSSWPSTVESFSGFVLSGSRDPLP